MRGGCLVNNRAVPAADHSTRQQIRLHIRYQRSFCSQPPSEEAAQLVLIVWKRGSAPGHVPGCQRGLDRATFSRQEAPGEFSGCTRGGKSHPFSGFEVRNSSLT
ncbi:hypothetical protein RCIA126 [Methanocella arvoryzae MRE50]|uniref:Uncharacterized protein n=1 Tax=Methanocella arvoryzae (strain DSM 22066 / NBRC 105507 / MRE50) TaxID=351160 RepID=Q0W490_METAR|nr:hypothetical protein RCIA126 [Methanocella arvoryzae MRE50]